MKIEDFQTAREASTKLAQIDAFVEAGLSRERSTKLVTILFDNIDKHFNALLTSFDKPLPDQLERSFVKSCLVVYLSDWVAGRSLIGEVSQVISLQQLKLLDADDRGSK